MNDDVLREAAARGKRTMKCNLTDLGYTDDELEFLRAMDRYKRVFQRPNPTCCEILTIIRELGYVKLPATVWSNTQENIPAAMAELAKQIKEIS